MRRSSYLHSIRGNKTHRSKPRCQIIEPALMLIVHIDLLSFAAMWPVSWRNQTHLYDRTIKGPEILCVKEYCGSKPAKYLPCNTINRLFLKSHEIMTDSCLQFSLVVFIYLSNIAHVLHPCLFFYFLILKLIFFYTFSNVLSLFPLISFLPVFSVGVFKNFFKKVFSFAYRSIEGRLDRNGRFRYCLRGEPYTCS